MNPETIAIETAHKDLRSYARLQQDLFRRVEIHARRPCHRIGDVELRDVYRRVRACA